LVDNSRDSSAKPFYIAFAFALFVTAHRIALHYFRIAFAFCIRITLFSHFCTFSTFLVDISRLMHQKVVKSARKMRKMGKNAKNAKKCEMRTQCENGIKIRIALL
jgi:hypothetical protein